MRFTSNKDKQNLIKEFYKNRPKFKLCTLIGYIMIVLGGILSLALSPFTLGDLTKDMTDFALYVYPPLGLYLVYYDLHLYQNLPTKANQSSNVNKAVINLVAYLPIDKREFSYYRIKKMLKVTGIYTLIILSIQLLIVLNVDHSFGVFPIIMQIVSGFILPMSVIMLDEYRRNL